MKSRRATIGWVISCFAIGLVLAIPPVLYFKGLEGVPGDREPISGSEIPISVARSYWRYIHGEGDPRISPKDPYEFLVDLYFELNQFDANERHTPEYALLSEAATSLMFRAKLDTKPHDWHLSNAAAFIWVSRNWSAHEAVATVLHDTYFGNGFHGLSEAAQGYLGVSLDEITDAQVMYLLIIRDAPIRFDPWCNAEIHRKRFDVFSARIGYDVEYDSIDVLPVPSRLCN